MDDEIKQELISIKITLKRLAYRIEEIRFGYLGITFFMVLANIILLLILIFR